MTAVHPCRAGIATLLLVLLSTAAASGQAAPSRQQQLEGLAAPLPVSTAPPAAKAGITLQPEQPHAGGLYLASFIGLAGGYLLGGIAGARIEQTHSEYCEMFCGVGGAILGALATGSVGAAFGAHVANDFDGNPLLGAGATLLAGAGSTLLAGVAIGTAGPGAALLLLGVPIVQVHTAVQVEQLTARRRTSR